eukprot:symbB.v1.2.035368.t1/scaffold4744.1/size35507/1
MAGSAQPSHRSRYVSTATATTSGQRVRPVGLQVQSLPRDDQIDQRPMLLLADLLKSQPQEEHLELLYMLMRPSPSELRVEWTIDWANDLRKKISGNRLGSYSILTLREENMGELDPIPCENDFPLRIRFEANQSDRVTSYAQPGHSGLRDLSRPMVSQSHPRNTGRKGKGQGKGKMTLVSTSGTANLEREEQMEVNRLAANLGQALLAGNWFEVNRLMKSPEEVWMLACSECGSRQLQELLRTSSHSEQAALKSQAVDKVILGLQSHVLEATVGSRGSFANYVLQALIQAPILWGDGTR